MKDLFSEKYRCLQCLGDDGLELSFDLRMFSTTLPFFSFGVLLDVPLLDVAVAVLNDEGLLDFLSPLTPLLISKDLTCKQI